MAGMLDNPDAAYAKLREMGKGLFGADGAGLGNILGNLGLGGTAAPGGGNAAGMPIPNPAAGTEQFARRPLGEALGNLIQRGLSAARETAPGPPLGAPPAPALPPAAAAACLQRHPH